MTQVSPTTPPPPYTSQFTFPKKHIITNTLVSLSLSHSVSLSPLKNLSSPNKQITKILESTDTALGLPSSCPTRLHTCPSSFFFFFFWKKWGTWLDATWSQPKKKKKKKWKPETHLSRWLISSPPLLSWSPPLSSSSSSQVISSLFFLLSFDLFFFFFFFFFFSLSSDLFSSRISPFALFTWFVRVCVYIFILHLSSPPTHTWIASF